MAHKKPEKKATQKKQLTATKNVEEQRDEFQQRCKELLADNQQLRIQLHNAHEEASSARKQRAVWEELYKKKLTKGAKPMSTTPNITPGDREWIAFAAEKLWACGCRELQTDPPFLILWCGQPNCLRLFEAQVAYTPLQVAWQRAHGVADPTIVGEFRLMRSPLPQVIPPPEDLVIGTANPTSAPTGQTAADASQGQIQGDNRSGLPDQPAAQQAHHRRKKKE